MSRALIAFLPTVPTLAASATNSLRCLMPQLCGSTRDDIDSDSHRLAAFLSFCLPDARHTTRSRFSCLGSKADTCIWRAKSIVSTSLHDLEEKPFLKCMGIDLEKFSIVVSIVKDSILLHRSQQAWIELVPTVDVVIIIVRNL